MYVGFGYKIGSVGLYCQFATKIKNIDAQARMLTTGSLGLSIRVRP